MYHAPLRDLAFVLDELIGSQALAGCADFADYSSELAAAVLGEAAKFAQEVLDPLNQPGDQEGARWTPEGVVAAQGFKDAYRQFVAGGWPQLGQSSEYGGQNVPRMLATAVQEIWASANLAFKLCPMLTIGAAHALELTGTPEQRRLYLEKMVRGEWTGTMVLTEPQAGSDLGLIRTRAVPEGDHYRLYGQKIFITWGDHDCTDNIIHMVLARIEGAPQGTRGISMFIVPKVLVAANGSLGARNDVRCVSIEHKLGIHASPTCVLAFGEKAGAIGYLVGEANRGLEYMFIMMNTARLAVGLEGYAVAERAFQHAAEYARSRLQGRVAVAPGSGATPTIIHHPDVKRMLLTMKSAVGAMRATALYAASQLDLAAHHADRAVRAAAQARGDLLIPIVKAWSTELGIELASLGIQVHGGMGYIEETGAAQYLRDVRITAIYEGTTGIQANDLIGRKIGRDGGAAMTGLLEAMRGELAAAQPSDAAAQAACRAALEAVDQLAAGTHALLGMLASSPERAAAVAVPYLMLSGFAIGGWQMARAAVLAAGKTAGAEREFYLGKLATAQFYGEQLLPRTLALQRIVERGAAAVAGVDAALI